MAIEGEKYDSTKDTAEHIEEVVVRLDTVRQILHVRGVLHDGSKLESPEKEAFDEVTPLLKALTYGSDEYRAALRKIKPALEHHYAHNSHHPEHYPNGVAGMDLIDLIEMYCDWAAAVKRTANGDLLKSIEINTERFKLDPQLASILMNTFERFRDFGPRG